MTWGIRQAGDITGSVSAALLKGVNNKGDTKVNPNSTPLVKVGDANFQKFVDKANAKGSVTERDVKSSVSVKAENRLISKFIARLYPSANSGTKQKYGDCLKNVKRSKQTAMRQRPNASKSAKSTKGTKGKSGVDSSQNTDDDDDDDSTEQSGAAGIGAVDKAGEAEESSFGNGESEQDSDGSDGNSSGKSLKNDIAEALSKNFPDDVANQDNMLELLQNLEDAEKGQAEAEIRQAKEMLKTLEKNHNSGEISDENYFKLKNEFESKIDDLTRQIEFSDTYKSELSSIRSELQKGHAEEIKKGYNLIPKANVSFGAAEASKFGSADKDSFATSVAAAYQYALGANTLDGVMQISHEIFGNNNWLSGLQSMLELCGIDLKSINPSSEVEVLVAVRDTLFRAEMSGQLYNVVGGLYDAMEEFIEEQKQEIKTEV